MASQVSSAPSTGLIRCHHPPTPLEEWFYYKLLSFTNGASNWFIIETSEEHKKTFILDLINVYQTFSRSEIAEGLEILKSNCLIVQR